MRQGILWRRGWRVKSGAVDGYGVARERGTTKMRSRRCWRSETGKSHPKKHPKSREAKRRVVCVFGTSDFGIFLAVPLPFIFCGKREGEPSGDPS